MDRSHCHIMEAVHRKCGKTGSDEVLYVASPWNKVELHLSAAEASALHQQTSLSSLLLNMIEDLYSLLN